jgi:hypothetical protein
MIYKILIISFILMTSLLSQTIEDSTLVDYTESPIVNLPSIHTDWTIINSPLLFYPMNTLESSYSNNPSLYALFTDSQLNTGLKIIQPEMMLNQFQLANNWNAKKKYGVFAKYLGIAQFMGAVGLAAIHISKFHQPPKGKADLKHPKKEKP